MLFVGLSSGLRFDAYGTDKWYVATDVMDFIEFFSIKVHRTYNYLFEQSLALSALALVSFFGIELIIYFIVDHCFI